MGEPLDYLCWSLALYRAGDLEAAAKKLLQTMLRNLYLLPALLGINKTDSTSGMAQTGLRKATFNMRQPKFSPCGMPPL